MAAAPVQLLGREVAVAAAFGGSPSSSCRCLPLEVGVKGEFLLPTHLLWAGAMLFLPLLPACWGEGLRCLQSGGWGPPHGCRGALLLQPVGDGLPEGFTLCTF